MKVCGLKLWVWNSVLSKIWWKFFLWRPIDQRAQAKKELTWDMWGLWFSLTWSTFLGFIVSMVVEATMILQPAELSFICLVGFLMSSSTTRLADVWQFYVLPRTSGSGEAITSVSAGHMILIPTQPVGSGQPQRESNPGAPYQESRALPTELLLWITFEAPKGNTRNIHFLLIFGNCPCTLRDMMKLIITKRYN